MAERADEHLNYPKQYSRVSVTFIDGEVKSYRMSAGATISQYLAKQVGETGVLALLCDGVSNNIPIAQVREYTIEPDN